MRILCYGASNTWGFKPGSFNSITGLAERYNRNERWTGVLQNMSQDYEIIEEGLNGRTTMFDDEIANKPIRNGLAYLPFCLESHYPIDLVIFMLGTNDLKIQYNKTVNEISQGMENLIQYVLTSKAGANALPPKVLVISPQLLSFEGLSTAYFNEISVKKSRELSREYEKICHRNQVDFLDITNIVESSKLDGIHFELSTHIILANVVYEKAKNIFLTESGRDNE